MHFLNPIWFTALAALSIPVVIHLWNIRPGKTLKVGSISIFNESSPASSRSFKLLDILLLILRCLLLAMVAVLLAAPFWQGKADRSAKGWMLIPHNYFNQAYHQYKNKIDSLEKKGYEFHYFDAGFSKEKLAEALKNDNSQKQISDSTNYWVLASQLDKKISKTIPVEVFVPDGVAHFGGNTPTLSHFIAWNTFTPADSVKTWLNNAWVTDNGSIRVIQGVSKPSGIAYQFTDIRNDNNSPLYTINTNNGQTSVRLKSADSIQTVVNNQVEQLAIYTENNETDANYLRAALEAVSKFMSGKVQVKVYHQPGAIPANADWLFWLSDDAVQSKNARHVFHYAGGKATANNAWLVNGGDIEHPQLFKSIADRNNEQSVWTDALGNIILGKKVTGYTETYTFYSRFNPTWSDLVWNDAFPNWLLQLLTKEPTVPAKNDTRRVAVQQVETYVATEQASFASQPNNTDLSRYIWYILVMLFFAERWLAHKTQISNG